MRGPNEAKSLVQHVRFPLMTGAQLLKVERSFITKIIPDVMTGHLNTAYRYHILNQQHLGHASISSEVCRNEKPLFISGRGYLDVQWCTPIYYTSRHQISVADKSDPWNSRNFSGTKSRLITSFDEKWQIEVKKYYNTVNIIVVLKKPLHKSPVDYRVWLS